MKNKKIIIALITLLIIVFNCKSVFAADNTSDEIPNINAKAALILDTKTKKVFYSKNENEKMYPASTTKILTAILALEHGNLDDTVTASYDAIMEIPEGYETANIQIGEELTIEQLLKVLLVHSANDAANVLAEYVGGSVESFASIMNTKANEIGLTNSHFTNAYGKHDPNHYTTANDMSKLIQYCMKNESFRKIAGSATCTIEKTNKSEARTYSSTNELLISNSKNYYRYLTVGKTGFTSQAQGCLVSAAYKDDLELVCVVLGCENGSTNRFTESKKLYEYVFNNYSIKNIANENDIATQISVSKATPKTKNLDLLISETIPALIKNTDLDNSFTPEIKLNDKISAPIEEGTKLGKIKYSIDDITYTTDLIASHSVEKTKAPMYVIIALILVVIGFILFRKNSTKKNRRRKKTKRIYRY